MWILFPDTYGDDGVFRGPLGCLVIMCYRLRARAHVAMAVCFRSTGLCCTYGTGCGMRDLRGKACHRVEADDSLVNTVKQKAWGMDCRCSFLGIMSRGARRHLLTWFAAPGMTFVFLLRIRLRAPPPELFIIRRHCLNVWLLVLRCGEKSASRRHCLGSWALRRLD